MINDWLAASAGFLSTTGVLLSATGWLLSVWVCVAAVRDLSFVWGTPSRRRTVASVLVAKTASVMIAQTGLAVGGLVGAELLAAGPHYPVWWGWRQVGICVAAAALLVWSVVDVSYRHWADEWS